MDPISLMILFGAGALAGYATQREAQDQSRDETIVLRKVYETFDGWICTELMSPQALASVGQILDLDLAAWWPKAQSGFFQVVVITQPGGPIDAHVVVLLERAGKYGWFLSQAFRHGYRKVDQRIDYQRIGLLLNALNTNPADEVVKRAAEISDPVKRFRYMRYALTANPQLSALLSKSDQFVELARQVRSNPRVEAVVESAHAQQPARALPYYPDAEEVRVRERVMVRE